MTVEVGILFGTLALVVLTAVLVFYTPFRQDVSRRAGTVISAVRKAISNAYQKWAGLINGRQLFWAVVLIVVAMWLLALASHANDLMVRPVSYLEIGLLVTAGSASVGALGAAYIYRSDEWQSIAATRSPAANDAAATVDDGKAKAKLVKDLRHQIYAKAAAMHKYAVATPGVSTPSDQVRTLNELIYRLVGQGEDVSAFAVPNNWILAGSLDNVRMSTHLEGLIIYLKDTKD
jgi:hypothetical protein